jgi:myo-inositol-1(or 4)-monophosphatase
MGQIRYEELGAVALAAARAGVAVQREHLGRVAIEEWSEKGVADFVTHVDREAEVRVIERIRRSFPDHAFLAEEGTAADPAATAAEWLWIIDPLDGTTNFLHGYPAYSASVAVARDGEVVAGAVVSGATGEAWTAIAGGGAFRDGQPIRVSQVEHLPRALIGTGFPFRALHLLPDYLDQFDAVLRRVSGIRRAGSAALDLCHVATGWLDGFWELVLAPWDVAAGTLIIREAGGIVTSVTGDADVSRGGSILAGNPAMHPALGDLIRSAPARPA